MSTTRNQSTELRPPALRRTSAISEVRFTPDGCRMARRMMIPTDDDSMYYWFTSIRGETTHHFETSSGIFSVKKGDTLPEFSVIPSRG